MSTNYEMLQTLSQRQMESFINSLIKKEASKYIDWKSWLGSEDPEPSYIGTPAFIFEDETENPCMVLEETETDGHPYRTFYQLLPKGMVRRETVPAYMVRLESEEEYPEYFEIEPEVPEIIEEPEAEPEIIAEPEAAEEPAAEPEAIEEPEIAEEPEVIEEPAAIAEEPEVIEEPAAEPEVIEEPVAEPEVIDEPVQEYVPKHARSEAPAEEKPEVTAEPEAAEEPAEEDEDVFTDVFDDGLLDELTGAIAMAEENENTITMRLQKIDAEEEERAKEAAAFTLGFEDEELTEPEELPEIAAAEPEEEPEEEEIILPEPEVTIPEEEEEEELILPKPEKTKHDTDTFTAPLLADDPFDDEPRPDDDEEDIERLSALVNELTGRYEIPQEPAVSDDEDEDDGEEGHVIGELLSSLKEKSELYDPNDPEDQELPTIAFTAMVDD